MELQICFFSIKDNELLDSNPGVRRIAHLRISPREKYGGLRVVGLVEVEKCGT